MRDGGVKNWRGISYASLLDNRFCHWLWKRWFCPKGWHLWDEVMSLEDHSLYCDACEMEVWLTP